MSDSPEARYRSVDLEKLTHGPLDAIVALPSGTCEELPATLLDAIGSCSELLPIADHARALVNGTSTARGKFELVRASLEYCFEHETEPPIELAPGVAVVRTALEVAAQRGLLRSEADLAELARSGAEDGEAAKIATIAVVTKHRPALLERSLASYVANGVESGRETAYIVADDSTDPSANRRAVADVADRFGVEVLYLGLDEKRALRDALVEEGFAPDDVEFAIGDPEGTGYTAGANRNALLLATAGSAVLSVDDDTVCRLSRAPLVRDGLTLATGHTHGYWAFPERDAALRFVPEVRSSVLECHEQLLGKSLGALFLAAQDGGGARGALASLERRLASRRARVLLTSTGWVGDNGSDASSYVLLEGDSLRRSLASEAAYRTFKESREVCRVVDSLTVTDHPFCMSTFVGLDNRALLPPFMPVLWAQDTVFGALLRQLHPGAMLGHLPWTLAHLRDDAPRGAGRTQRTRRRFAELVADFIARAPVSPSEDPAARARQVGAHLRELSKLPREDFAQYVKQQELRYFANDVRSIERALAGNPGALEAWQRDTQQRIQALRANLAAGEVVEPFPQDRSAGAPPMERLQRLVGRFGNTLGAWPDLWEAARRGLRDGRQGRWAGMLTTIGERRPLPPRAHASSFAAEPAPPPKVSVIVPVFDDRERLLRCLAALEQQTYPSDLYEVIVVDNAPAPSVGPLGDDVPHARAVHEPRAGSYAARNTGIASATGDVLAFTDSDCVPDPTWLASAVARLRGLTGDSIVAGAIGRLERGAETMAALYDRTFFLTQESHVRLGGYCATANMVTWARTFAAVGRFRDEMKSGGDREWSSRARSRGCPLVYAPEVVVRHPTIASTSGIIAKSRRIVGGNVMLGNAQRYDAKRMLRNLSAEVELGANRWRAFGTEHANASTDVKAKMAGLIVLVQAARMVEHGRLFVGGDPRRR